MGKVIQYKRFGRKLQKTFTHVLEARCLSSVEIEDLH